MNVYQRLVLQVVMQLGERLSGVGRSRRLQWIEMNFEKRKEKKSFDSLSPVFDGSNVHNCFFFRLAPFAFNLKPNVSAVMYLCSPLIKPIVHQPFCWFCDSKSPFVWMNSMFWPFILWRLIYGVAAICWLGYVIGSESLCAACGKSVLRRRRRRRRRENKKKNLDVHWHWTDKRHQNQCQSLNCVNYTWKTKNNKIDSDWFSLDTLRRLRCVDWKTKRKIKKKAIEMDGLNHKPHKHIVPMPM